MQRALSGRFAPRDGLPEWLRVPRWATSDSPVFEGGDAGRAGMNLVVPDGQIVPGAWSPALTEQLLLGYAERGANTVRWGTFWGGWAKYPSQVAPVWPYLQDGFDPLALAMCVARRYGQKVLAYLNPNAWMAGHPLHEVACVRRPDGSPDDRRPYGRVNLDARYACPNHPAFREFYEQAIVELIGAYGADGLYLDGLSPHVCCCEHCQAGYREHTGADIPAAAQTLAGCGVLWEMTAAYAPLGDVAEAELQRYVGWLGECYTGLTRWLTATARAVAPTAVVVYHTWPKPECQADYDATLNEIYVREPWAFTLWKRAEFANWGDVFEVPSLVNVYLSRSAGGLDPRPITSEVEARHMYWQALANGAYPNGWGHLGMARPFEVMAQHADCFDFAATRPLRTVALPRWMMAGGDALLAATARALPLDGASPSERFVAPAVGWFAALLHGGLPIKQMHANHLTAASLDGFAALILANHAPLSDDQCAAVRAFVAGGGGLVATGQTSLCDGDGRARPDLALADVLGVSADGTAHLRASWRQSDGVGGSGQWQPVRATRGTVRTTDEDGQPAVVAHEYGAGRAVYLAGGLDRQYGQSGDGDLRGCLTGAVDWVSRGAVPCRIVGAGGRVGLSALEQPERRRWLLHLVCYAAPWNEPFDTLPVVTDTVMAILPPAGLVLRAARAVLAGERLEVTAAGDGGLLVRLTRLDEYEIVSIEWADDGTS